MRILILDARQADCHGLMVCMEESVQGIAIVMVIVSRRSSDERLAQHDDRGAKRTGAQMPCSPINSLGFP